MKLNLTSATINSILDAAEAFYQMPVDSLKPYGNNCRELLHTVLHKNVLDGPLQVARVVKSGACRNFNSSI